MTDRALVAAPVAAPMIRVRDLSIGWSRDEVLLEHASFEIRRGEIFGILGRSACGKSTLFRVLIGLERPLAGEISLAGGGAPRLAAGRPQFGVMFQQGALFGSLTVGDNVALPLARWTDLPGDAIRALVRAKLELVGLEDAEDLLPAELSGGMRKRVGIARAIAGKPKYLLYDEPTSGLDPVNSDVIDQLVERLQNELGVTSVVVTHDVRGAFRVADRIALLWQAKIRAVGTPEEIVQSQDPAVQQFLERDLEMTIIQNESADGS
jgi:phospholipid/cholesterol/gamma-HCH transport system ATP-binding protein